MCTYCLTHSAHSTTYLTQVLLLSDGPLVSDVTLMARLVGKVGEKLSRHFTQLCTKTIII